MSYVYAVLFWFQFHLPRGGSSGGDDDLALLVAVGISVKISDDPRKPPAVEVRTLREHRGRKKVINSSKGKAKVGTEPEPVADFVENFSQRLYCLNP
jgi:hypothetical protein